MRLLPDAARVSSPWKNGGGSTREIAAFPPGAGLGAFEWRLSLARVEAGGPFSVFEGVDRILAVVEGGPVVLTFEDGERAVIGVDAAPFAFPGDQPVHGEPGGGGLTDLNLMVRRGVRRGALERLLLDAALPIGGGGETLVVALDPVRLDHDGHLDPLDAAWLAPGEAATLWPRTVSARVLIASVWAA